MIKKSIERVWCSVCIDDNRPSIIRKAAFLVPVRTGYYDLLPNADFDLRLIGVCAECLITKNQFQRDNKTPADVNNINIIYKSV
jgi:hypothetical protein